MTRRGVLSAAAALAAAAVSPSACTREDAGVRTIEFWTLALSPWFDDYLRERCAAFEADHPGVRVRWTDVPFDAVERKLIAAASAGAAPDVINLSDLNFARFAGLGAFRELSDLPGDPREQYLESPLALCLLPTDRADGGDAGGRGSGGGGVGGRRLMGLPWYLTPQVSIVNRALLERGGITADGLPATWLGLLGRASEFRERTGRFLFSQPLGEESQLLIMLMGEGISPLRSGEHGRPRAQLRTPEVLRFLGAWASAYRSGALPRAAATTGHAHLVDMYQRGQLGVISTGPSFVTRIEKSAPEIFADTVVRPGTTGSRGSAHVPVMPIAVSAQSRHPALASAFAWFITGPASQTAFCRLVPIMPSTRASLTDPLFAPPPPEELATATGLVRQARALSAASLPTATAFTVAHPAWPDLRRRFEDGVKRVLLDGADLDRAMARVEVEWDALLSQGPPAAPDIVPLPRTTGPRLAGRVAIGCAT